jgi:hypothetical protein
MPRLLKSAARAAALVCASLLAQPSGTSLARRAGRPPEPPRNVTRPDTRARATTDFGRLPVTFEANRGQAETRFEYLARGAGYTLKLGQDGALLSLKSPDAQGAHVAQISMSFPGAAAGARPEGLGLTGSVSNYFKGGDPRRWVAGVENYARVVYAGLYEGVDLIFHGTGGRVEYDFRLSPGADERRVKVRFDGAGRARLGADGALVLRTRAGEVRQPKPFAYQEDGAGRRIQVACDYVLGRRGEVGFRLGAYDRARVLVIDPVFVYSTYLGASVSASDVAVDAAGSAYVVGRDINGDALVRKLNPAGTGLVYSTYVGGSGDEFASAVALDAGGNAYVAGWTTSANFPTSSDAFDKTCGNNGTCNDLGSGTQSDAFVFKLNPAGNALVYSTYLGGSGVEPIPSQTNWPASPKLDVAVEAGGSAYVTGSTTSQDFPTTAGAFRTTPATSFVTKLNPAGSALVYSTYFPGAIAQAVALDAAGLAHITGMTTTSDSNPPTLPVVNAYQPTLGGQFTFDAFAAKLNASGSGLIFSTFLGGATGPHGSPRGGDDAGSDIGVDAAGNVYVSGTTRSGCFPASSPYVAPQTCPSGTVAKQFLVKFAPAGDALLFSKKMLVLSGPGGSLRVEPSGLSTVAWTCLRKIFSDVCVNRESPAGETLYTTFLGGANADTASGVAADGAGHVYLAGTTLSNDFPTTPGSHSPAYNPSPDSFVSKFSTADPEVQFGGGSTIYAHVVYEVGEGDDKVTARVERSGNLSAAFSVDFATVEGTAGSRSDYTAATGTLHFAPYETAKTFDVFITDDAHGPEGLESFALRLSNPTDGAVLGANSGPVVLLSDNDAADGQNPVVPPGFDAEFFVRQHYRDFLGREPDPQGLAFWSAEFAQCAGEARCLEAKRINVSAAFFLSIEFQETGYLVHLAHKAAYAFALSPGVPNTVPVVRLSEFLPDARALGEGVAVGQGDWRVRLEANKEAYMLDFVARPRFLSTYPLSMTATQFVNKLDQSAFFVLSPAEHAALVAELDPAPADPQRRASALRKVAEHPTLRRREFNNAFVLMEYFGYLRRNPDDPPDTNYAGWRFWLSKLEQFKGDYVAAEMVKAFLDSGEYRRRFGP